MSDNKLLLAAVVAATGLGIVYYTSQPRVQNPLGPGYTPVPPGGYYGGYQNQSNTALYVNFAGQIFNTLGQLIGNLADAGVFTPNSDPDDNDPYYDDNDYWEVLGSRVGSYGACQCANGQHCVSSKSGTCECCDQALIRNVFAYAKRPTRLTIRPVGGL